MSVYEKLQKSRIELQKMNLKKSGKNKFSGYDYFELSDFLPSINEIFHNNKLCGVVSFDEQNAILRVVDTEKPDNYIEFSSPMAKAELKGCHAIQNLGAVETYQRRYLYMIALEITEHDVLDATTGKEDSKPATKTFTRKVDKPADVPKVINNSEESNGTQLSKKQIGYFRHIQAETKLTDEEVRDLIEGMGLKSSKELTTKTLTKLLEKMQERAKSKDDDTLPPWEGVEPVA